MREGGWIELHKPLKPAIHPLPRQLSERMRNSRPVELREREQAAAALQRIFWMMTSVVGVPALLAGLFTLTARPLLGVLMVIAAMAALLYSANGFCQGPGVLGSILRRNNKENAYGTEQRD
jgi:xanthine/uracil permease